MAIFKKSFETEQIIEIQNMMKNMTPDCEEYQELMNRRAQLIEERNEKRPPVAKAICKTLDYGFKAAEVGVKVLGTIAVPMMIASMAYVEEKEKLNLPNGRIFNLVGKDFTKK